MIKWIAHLNLIYRRLRTMRADIAELQAAQVALTAAVQAVETKMTTVASAVLGPDDVQAIADIKTGVDAATAALQGIAG